MPDDAVASGSFFAGDESPEAYAMRDGRIYLFDGGSSYDIHVFVDMDDDQELTPDDMERSWLNLHLFEDQTVEVDYLDFTIVD